ncbi:hypothetical protein CVS40_7697 [Lucilia cuprina]|nr:hypothetical protein CVS40_7697 [Lucilia cuprina]
MFIGKRRQTDGHNSDMSFDSELIEILKGGCRTNIFGSIL